MGKNYDRLDAGKLFMAICVVAIHTHPLEFCTLESVNRLYNVFIYTAVPYFFLATGFLLGEKMKAKSNCEKAAVFKQYAHKTIRLYLIWNILYFPLAVYGYCMEGRGIGSAVLEYIRGLLFIGQHFHSWQLWYLLSAIYAVTVLAFLNVRGVKKGVILLLGVILFLIGTVMTALIETGATNSFIFLWSKVFGGTGRLFYGLFYIEAGICISGGLKKLRDKTGILAAGVCFGLICGYVAGDGILAEIVKNISRIPIAAGLLCFSVKDGKRSISIPGGGYIALRKISTVLYFVHMWVFSLYCLAEGGRITFGPEAFLTTITVSLTAGLILVLIHSKKIDSFFF